MKHRDYKKSCLRLTAREMRPVGQRERGRERVMRREEGGERRWKVKAYQEFEGEKEEKVRREGAGGR